MLVPLNIAIDGPAGAGKTTIAKQVADYLHIQYLDTGAMYRALAYKALQEGVDPSDRAAVERMLRDTRVDVLFDQDGQKTRLDGAGVDAKIRDNAVSRAASDISVHGCVREYMVRIQREIAASMDLVLDGRDIGSYVLPNAPVKVFLTARPEVRAQRRFDQLAEKGDPGTTVEALAEEIRRRDYQDANREIAPLTQAEDAQVLDTSDLTIRQVTQEIIKIVGGGV